MLHTAWNSKGEMPYRFPRSFVKFQGHTVQNITDFDPNWAFPDYRPVAAFKSLRFALFTRGQFWPSGVVVACVCVSVCMCVCVSVNHELVRAIIHQPFTLGSPNLVQRSKTPWLRSLSFFGAIDLDLQGQIKLQTQNWPHFELVQTITHHLF